MRIIGWNVGSVLLWFVYLAAARIPEQCAAPPLYPHARLLKKYMTKMTFRSGDKVYYNCAEDSTPFMGIRFVHCLNGTWTKLTLLCQKDSCGNAGDLPNGQFEYEGNAHTGDKAQAVCNKGYTLNGPSHIICKKSGWSEFPSCEVGEATCATPAVKNSVSSGGRVSVHRVGDRVSFTCKRGFQLHGAQPITCGPDGRWQPRPPRCLPSRDGTRSPAGRCGVPETTTGSHANLADKYTAMTSFASGVRVYYSCGVGRVQARGSRSRTCVGGEWTPLLLRCERKLCGTAGEIDNGAFIYSGVQFGDTAKGVCNEGYRLVGKRTRNCLSKGWDGRVPICEAVECDDPPVVINADIEGDQGSPYTYRSVVRYQCKVGTLKGAREIWCTNDGTWNAPPPTCEDVTCPSPNVPGAFWSRAWMRLYQYRDTISIECDPRYRRIGPSIITCGGDGKWTPGLPRCS